MLFLVLFLFLSYKIHFLSYFKVFISLICIYGTIKLIHQLIFSILTCFCFLESDF